MKSIPDNAKFTIAAGGSYPGEHCPNPQGWYHSVAGVVHTDDGLVCVYRRSDAHCALSTDIMAAYSRDGGRTWEGHRCISHRDVWQDHRVWIAPQLSRLRDGRLVILCDMGHRTSQNDWPMLSQWQKRPPRGMENYLFWSADNGKTWSEPVLIDRVGGEPSYILDLSDGTLVYTRTESAETDRIEDPPMPWGSNYYRSVAVFSDDGGKTWDRTLVVTDDPFHGDCEVGLVELEPGHLMAMTRAGFGGGAFGQPSRIVHSHDGGRTWEKPTLSPFYGQRTILGKLQSGRLLVTYRNRWGTFGSYACVFDADEPLGFEPASFLWHESRCTISDDVMTLRTDEGLENGVEFSLYPVLDSASSADIEVDLRVESGACHIMAGCGVTIEAGRVYLTQRRGDGFALDAAAWRRYRVVRQARQVAVFVDGKETLRASTQGIAGRPVRFGSARQGVTHWRAVRAKIENPGDYSIDWTWHASGGYPDSFRRDRMVLLDLGAESGYSGWTQLPDGTIVIVDYTNQSIHTSGSTQGPQPFLRAYVAREEDLTP